MLKIANVMVNLNVLSWPSYESNFGRSMEKLGNIHIPNHTKPSNIQAI